MEHASQERSLSPLSRRSMLGLCGMALAFAFFPLNQAASEQSPYVAVTTDNGITISIPRNWTLLTQSQQITLDASAEARMSLAGFERVGTSLPLAANLYEGGITIALMNIRVYSDIDVSQAEAASAPDADVRELDQLIREGIETVSRAQGISIMDWHGTRRQIIEGKHVFVSNYVRTSVVEGGPPFDVKLVRFIDGPQSFTVTISMQASQNVLLEPIREYMIQSIRY